MIRFKRFLTESTAEKEEKLKHLEHPEDHFLNVGHEGFEHAKATLHAVHNSLLGAKGGIHKLTLKADGAPSIVAGIHPETKRFFVGSKSVFNKNPKINYTEKDIDDNHGHAPGLAEKLKLALKHLPKVISSGVHQGDYLHDKSMRTAGKDGVKFRANTIEHSVKNGDEAKKIKNSKIGIAFHTSYTGKTIADLKANFGAKTKFSEHPDVHNMDLNRDFSKDNYRPHYQKTFIMNMHQADKIHKENPPYNVVLPHGETMKQYVNHTVRTGEKKSAEGYKKFLASKPKLTNAFHMQQHVDDNLEHFENAFKMHTHIETAKNALIKSFHEPHGDHEFSTNGKPTKPEGYVAVTKDGRPTKLVDRSEFSKNNFAKPKDFGKKK